MPSTVDHSPFSDTGNVAAAWAVAGLLFLVLVLA